jgi:hypothetical protein
MPAISPAAVAGGRPGDAEPAGEFPAELGGGDGGGSGDLAVEVGVDGPMVAVLVE